MTTNTTPSSYNTLEEIRTQRDNILNDIRKDDEKIREMWGSLFRKPQMLTATTPSKRISGLLSVGAGTLDAAILGWKLYRQFHKKKRR